MEISQNIPANLKKISCMKAIRETTFTSSLAVDKLCGCAKKHKLTRP